MGNILLLDNFDSFTYNIVNQLRMYKHNVIIYRNIVSLNTILSVLSKLRDPIILLSPGPGQPKYSGCMLNLLQFIIGKIPVIGICLGYQAIIEYYGGNIERSKKIFHGKTSYIQHDQQDMFHNLPNPLLVARYHSLICKNIPKKLIINAYVNKIAMSIKNNKDKVCGFQFHPESILTTHGTRLLYNTLMWINEKVY